MLYWRTELVIVTSVNNAQKDGDGPAARILRPFCQGSLVVDFLDALSGGRDRFDERSNSHQCHHRGRLVPTSHTRYPRLLRCIRPLAARPLHIAMRLVPTYSLVFGQRTSIAVAFLTGFP